MQVNNKFTLLLKVYYNKEVATIGIFFSQYGVSLCQQGERKTRVTRNYFLLYL